MDAAPIVHVRLRLRSSWAAEREVRVVEIAHAGAGPLGDAVDVAGTPAEARAARDHPSIGQAFLDRQVDAVVLVVQLGGVVDQNIKPARFFEVPTSSCRRTTRSFRSSKRGRPPAVSRNGRRTW